MLVVQDKKGVWHAFHVTISFLKIVGHIVARNPADSCWCEWCHEFVEYGDWKQATAREVAGRTTHGQFLDGLVEEVHDAETRRIGNPTVEEVHDAIARIRKN